MVITCPECQARYRIDPAASKSAVARVKCPACQHRFEIPLHNESAAPDAATPALPLVLIVDDARFFREMIKDILKELSIDIITAADGDEAWELMASRTPQLVLLDLNIPGKSGKDILQALQNSPMSSQMKVLAMSGVERGEDTAREVRRIGAADFINKSFKPSELEKRVRSLLAF